MVTTIHEFLTLSVLPNDEDDNYMYHTTTTTTTITARRVQLCGAPFPLFFLLHGCIY